MAPLWGKFTSGVRKFRAGVERFNRITSHENIEKYVMDDPLGYRQIFSQSQVNDIQLTYNKIEQEVSGMFEGMDLLQGFPSYESTSKKAEVRNLEN